MLLSARLLSVVDAFPPTPKYQLGLVSSLAILYHQSSGFEQRELKPSKVKCFT